MITAFDDTPVHTAGDVSSRVGMAQPGQRLALQVWRDKAAQTMSVALGKAQAEPRASVAAAERGALGLAVRPLQRDEMREAGVDHGLLIEDASGPAREAGVQAGDVLLALNGKPVNGVDQVRDVMRRQPKHVALLIARDGQQIFVPVNLG